MPYITENRREALCGDGASAENPGEPQNAGELNFILTMVVLDFVREHGVSYATFNDVSGALTECLAEFRRRLVAPYENVKSAVNGDVYAAAVTQMVETFNG